MAAPPLSPAGADRPQQAPHLVQLLHAAKEASDSKNAWTAPSALSDAGLGALGRAAAPAAVESSGPTAAESARTRADAPAEAPAAAPAAAPTVAAEGGAPDEYSRARRASVQATLLRMSERLRNVISDAGAEAGARARGEGLQRQPRAGE